MVAEHPQKPQHHTEIFMNVDGKNVLGGWKVKGERYCA